MKNFTLKMFSFLLLGFIGITTYAQEWNIGSPTISVLGTVAETTTVEGLTIAATADATVVIEGNNKSLDGVDYTSRLKLGGSGTFDADGKPVSRVLSFNVTGNTTITIVGMSSSSGSDRELVIAAGTKDTEVARFPALGPSISKGEYTYTGGPTTIYLFSPSSGVNLYSIKSTPVVTDQEWNIGSATISALGTVAETTTVEGLTIAATADATVVIEGNNKSLDGVDYTSRLKLGGTGAFDADGKPVSRVLSFNVSGNTTITIVGMSSSSGSDRELVIAAGTKDTEVARFPALGPSISKGEYNYTGGPTTIYLFSPSSGVNLYYIKATPLTTGIKVQKTSELKVYPNPASGKVYINVNEPTEIGIYSITGQLVKRQVVASSRNYINVSDLHSGIYFVKMMKSNSNAQKLIIQ